MTNTFLYIIFSFSLFTSLCILSLAEQYNKTGSEEMTSRVSKDIDEEAMKVLMDMAQNLSSKEKIKVKIQILCQL